MNNGYAEVKNPTHPRARKNGFIYVHILIAERRIGRYLLPGEVVHHLDKNRTNNLSENLIVFKTTGDHTRFHKGSPLASTDEMFVFYCPPNIDLNKKRKTEKTIKRKGYHYKKKKTNKCPECGTTIQRDSIRCKPCAMKQRSVMADINLIELRLMVKYNTIPDVSILLDKSQHSLRRFCNTNRIPFLRIYERH